jgi:fatty-acyl-CoA synthase
VSRIIDASPLGSALAASAAERSAAYARLAAAEAARWAEVARSGIRSWADAWERAADAHGARIAVVIPSGSATFTYADLDRAADRVAAWASASGERAIAVRKENGFAFLAAAIGLAKAGVLAVLVNTREPLDRAAELASGAGATRALGDGLPGAQSIEDLLAWPWPGRAPAENRAARVLEDPCWVIFTSGTSGRSKGALFSHKRMIGAGIAWSLRVGLGPADRCYIPLPLYHGNALAVAFSSVVTAGATAVVPERFSARAFVDDVRAHGCTACVYIGELWRYLDRTPARPEDGQTPLRAIFGNGLGRDLWARTVRRFGVAHVVEHYGATELPAGALTNWLEEPGACGFIPPDHADNADVALVDADGRRVALGEPGEVILRVKAGVYRGYTDPAHDEPKLWRGLFAPGDLWWRSGDILTVDARGFFTFVERAGDGFRWKGENVAAVDVEDAIRATGLVRDVAVYGLALPHHDGKAGVASLVAREAEQVPDLAALLAALRARLPAYAIPRVIRVRWDEHPLTTTLKVQKAALAAQGLDAATASPHFVLESDAYVPLDAARLADLRAGRLALP